MDRDVEQRLINNVRSGDSEALAELLYSSKKGLMGIIKVTAVKEDADDIFNELYLYMHENFSKYDEEKSRFSTFLVKTLVKIVLPRYINKKYRFENHESATDPELFFNDNERFVIQAIATDFHNRLESVYDCCLEILFCNGGTPHQIMAFGYNRLIYPAKQYTRNGYPGKVVERLSDVLLQRLGGMFQRDYCIYLEKLSNEILNPFYTAIEKEENSIRIADKCLRHYYGNIPEKDVADWSNKVKNRVAKLVREKYWEVINEEYYLLEDNKQV